MIKKQLRKFAIALGQSFYTNTHIQKAVYKDIKLHKICDFAEKYSTNDTRPIAVLIHFKKWKHDFAHHFLPEYRVAYLKLQHHNTIVFNFLSQSSDIQPIVWGQQGGQALREKLPRLFAMEDGFLRSYDLGVNGANPYSLVLDKTGIYYNCQKPSDLEHYMTQHIFTDDERLEAAQAVAFFRKIGVSKYNNYKNISLQPYLDMSKQERVLVVGQVEDDQSILSGTNQPVTNNDLVRLAHKENPNAQILYKIHPDVLVNKRGKKSDPKDVEHLCTILNLHVQPKSLFENVSKVYTITSLMGFEAIMHNKEVICLGAPFYSGWGLTDDRTPISRRHRKLTLDELFYSSYIWYPRYYNVEKDCPISVQDTMSAIIKPC